MTAPASPRCRVCGAPIRWTRTGTGWLAIDPRPVPGGPLAVYRAVSGRLHARHLTPDRPSLEGAERPAMPHRATCTPPER